MRRPAFALVTVAFAVVSLLGPPRHSLAQGTTAFHPVPANELDLGFEHIVYSTARDTLYGSTRDGRVVAVDPLKLRVLDTVAVGGFADVLAVSDDGTTLWVGLPFSHSVRRVDLDSFSAGLTVTLGTDRTGDPLHAEDLEVMPGATETFVVSLANAARIPSHEAVAVFDGPVRRPDIAERQFGSRERVEFGADSTVVYGLETDLSTFAFHTYDITPDGIEQVDVVFDAVDRYGLDFVYDDGQVLFSHGVLYDPVAGVSTGRLPGTDSGTSGTSYVEGYSVPTHVEGHAVTVSHEPDGPTLVLRDIETFGLDERFTLPTRIRDQYIVEVVNTLPGQMILTSDGVLTGVYPFSVRFSAGEFTPLTPARILDTRRGLGAAMGPIGPLGQVAVQLTGRSGVPAEEVKAVVMNATVTEPTGTGFVALWPAGSPRPTVSNLNFVPGQTVANLVTIPVGDNGRISAFNSGGSSHLVLDVVGYYAESGGTPGSRYRPLEPNRLLDTRNGRGGVGLAPLGPSQSLRFDVRGRSGVPSAGATAVVMNVTVTDTSAEGYLTVSPGDVARPTASNLNFVAGVTVPNLVTVRVPADGVVEFFNSAGSTHLIADVVGYYVEDDADESGRFIESAPFRLYDTRDDPGSPIPPGATDRLVNLPPPFEALVLNVTVTEPTTAGYVTVHPSPGPTPLASNLNFEPGQTVPNMVISPVRPDLAIYNNAGHSHVIVDVFGVFTGPG